MAAITAQLVKELRELTGVGMMDCKKALVAADGDKDKAIDWLREKGLAAQTKKAGKVAAEGVSYATVIDSGVGAVIEVNSQTDFVAKNATFQEFVRDVATVVAEQDPALCDRVFYAPFLIAAQRAVKPRKVELNCGDRLRELLGQTVNIISRAYFVGLDRL